MKVHNLIFYATELIRQARYYDQGNRTQEAIRQLAMLRNMLNDANLRPDPPLTNKERQYPRGQKKAAPPAAS